LQTLPASDLDEQFDNAAGNVAGFSLHAGVATKAHQRKKLERLCRYIARPAVSEKRLSLTAHGKVRYELKTPYRDGTTHIIFEPLDFGAHPCAPPFGRPVAVQSALLPISHCQISSLGAI